MIDEQLANIIDKCKKRDKQAFKLLMVEYTDYVFALAFRVLNDEEEAKDIVQETFIRVWQNSEHYKDIPFPIDSTWQINYQLDSNNVDKKHIYVFKKHYENGQQLNSGYKNDSSNLSKYKRQLKVEKKFRWFYTYFSYKESYEKLVQGEYRRFNQYLSDIEKEIRKFDGVDSIDQVLELDTTKIKALRKGIEEKFEKWFEENIKEEIIIAIEKDLEENEFNKVSKNEIRQNADAIF